MRYRRNRLKDSVVIPVWVIALLPVSPVVFLLILHHLLEGFIDWYNKLALQPIRNWRNRWNPKKEYKNNGKANSNSTEND